MPGYHTVKIVIIEGYISLDGIYFKPIGLKRIPFGSLTYSSGWSIDNKQWGGEQSIGNYTEAANSYIQCSFNGTFLLISGTIGPTFHNANITIDGQIVEPINCINLKKDSKSVIAAYELSQKVHTVRISYKDGPIGFSGFYLGKYYTSTIMMNL